MNKQQESIMNMATLASQRANDLLALCVKAQDIMLNESTRVFDWGQERDDMKVWLAEFKDYLEKALAEGKSDAQ